jgi:FkbM family methyltransferase
LKVFPGNVKIPPSGKLRFIVNGKKMILHTNQTNYVTSLLFWEGYENFEYTKLFKKICTQSDVFFDIGANIGYYSVLFSVINPIGKTYSFEPATGPFHYLQKNCKSNQIKSIICEKLAIYNTEGQTEFLEVKNNKYKYLKYNLAGEGNLGTKEGQREYIKNIVHTTTLENYVHKNSIDKIDLIKIDTEGTEHLILQKAKSILDNLKPIVICEILFQKNELELEQIFTESNYEMYIDDNSYLKKVKTIIREKDDGIRNVFFIHSSRKNKLDQELFI